MVVGRLGMVAALAVVGCGRVAYQQPADASDPQVDASPDAAPTPDAPTDLLVSATGAFVVADPPPSLEGQIWESDTEGRVIHEAEDILLGNALDVDITEPGNYTAFDTQTYQISAGTRVSSFLVHVDPVGTPGPLVVYAGSLTFRQPILGFIAAQETHAAADARFAMPSVTYPSGTRECDNGEDSVQLSDDRMSATMVLRTNLYMDHLRIIVQE